MGITYDGDDYRPFGSHGLTGCVDREKRLVSIKGPCGEGHTMNFDAARDLASWLLAVVRGMPTLEDFRRAEDRTGFAEDRQPGGSDWHRGVPGHPDNEMGM